jgi:hypothetical protein
LKDKTNNFAMYENCRKLMGYAHQRRSETNKPQKIASLKNWDQSLAQTSIRFKMESKAVGIGKTHMLVRDCSSYHLENTEKKTQTS